MTVRLPLGHSISAYRRAEFDTVYAIGIFACYWLIERFLGIFPSA